MTRTAPITLFLPSLDAGGAERVMLILAGRFATQARGCHIVVARSGGLWESKVPDGVRLVSLGKSGKPLSVVRPLIDYLRRERPAVVLSSVFPANIAALLACVVARTPCVVREANRTEDDIRSPGWRTTLFNRIAMRMLYPRANAVVALTQGLAAHIAHFAAVDASRITVIPNPAPTPHAQARTRHAVPIVLGCGRLVPQKDFGTLVHAFANLVRRRPARLVLLGEGPLADALKGLAHSLGVGPDVSFAGHAPDVVARMHDADVFVLSSRFEGFPNVLLEAMAARAPIVATDCSDSVPALLANGRYGTIVPVGGAEAMAAAIGDILDGKVRFDDPTNHLAGYDPDVIANRYLEVLDRVAQGAR